MDYKKYIEEKKLYILDYYGATIREFRGFKYYENDCTNKSIISESSLSHILDLMHNRMFAIITAHRAKLDSKTNMIRNRQLRDIFNQRKMGVHSLIGHWQECQLKDKKGNLIDYQHCPKNQLKDVIERSYLVIKPSDMTQQDFEKLIVSSLTIDDITQDGALIKDENNTYSIIDDKGVKYKIGTNIKLNKIAQAYSQHIKKQNVPFVFEGLEVPNGSIMSYQIWNNKEQNFRYDKVD
ncbi:MAG: hypothetical protein PHF86_13450 [Candidatus Nanoarchaeia archaeon]|nr:hypothetical protein [Candidatus Nanoarchaeia archaeon]